MIPPDKGGWGVAFFSTFRLPGLRSSAGIINGLALILHPSTSLHILITPSPLKGEGWGEGAS